MKGHDASDVQRVCVCLCLYIVHMFIVPKHTHTPICCISLVSLSAECRWRGLLGGDGSRAHRLVPFWLRGGGGTSQPGQSLGWDSFPGFYFYPLISPGCSSRTVGLILHLLFCDVNMREREQPWILLTVTTVVRGDCAISLTGLLNFLRKGLLNEITFLHWCS